MQLSKKPTVSRFFRCFPNQTGISSTLYIDPVVIVVIKHMKGKGHGPSASICPESLLLSIISGLFVLKNTQPLSLGTFVTLLQSH